jgi:hypothetical protein
MHTDWQVTCPPGQHINQQLRRCSDCPRGQYSAFEDASLQCTPCPSGYHTPTANATSCSICLAGSYAPAEGGASCWWCASACACACASVRAHVSLSVGACELIKKLSPYMHTHTPTIRHALMHSVPAGHFQQRLRVSFVHSVHTGYVQPAFRSHDMPGLWVSGLRPAAW